MTTGNHCPECSQPLTQVGKFWICPEHGTVSPEKPFQPLRIFLSYGHDPNEELVRRIKVDLEKRGHDVWFDKSEIKAGDDWRRSITDGVLQSNRVLSFLSKYSTRDPGVCRDEIAIAIGVKGGNIQTILVESEQEVQPPVNIGHVQWLDMHDWRERRGADEAAWEQWYQAKFAEIAQVVESDESRRFAGEIETLSGHLKPIKSDARICQLLSKGFYGREWLFEAVENWRKDTKHGSRLLWIMGAPGVGKSAFAAQLTHTRSHTVIAAQFCEWDKPDHRNAQRVVRSLAFQLATRLPDYRKLLLTLPEITSLDGKNEAELFEYILANPLFSAVNGGRERYLIVIDALDEAGESGRNPLVEMLARNAESLPEWLGLVVTSRPEYDVKTPLQGLKPEPFDTTSESNRADIRDYLRHELASQLETRTDADRHVEQVLERSEGVFLYVERFCDDVRQGHLSLDRPEQFPQGLGGIFCQYFQRQFPDEEEYGRTIEPALGAILAAREPLPVELLQKLLRWRQAELRKLLRVLGSLFPVMNDNGTDVIRPWHKSLADWLANPEESANYVVDVQSGRERLADFCWSEFDANETGMSRYTTKHLAIHLLESKRWWNLLVATASEKLDLTRRWVERGEGSDGLRCLVGLIENGRLKRCHSAALATQVARIHSRRGEYELAENWLRYAVARTRWWQGRRIRAIAIHELASLYLYRNDTQSANHSYKEALRLCIWGFPGYPDEAAANRIGLATVAVLDHNWDQVLRLANRAYRNAVASKSRQHEIAAQRLIACTLDGIGNYPEARGNFEKALQTSEREGIDSETAQLKSLLGWHGLHQAALTGQPFTEAVRCLEEARLFAERASCLHPLLEARCGLGWCALAEERTDDAARWFDEVEISLPTGVHSELLADVQLGRAAVIHQRGDMEEAEAAYRLVNDLYKNARSRRSSRRALVGLGAVLWHTDRRDEAHQTWDIARRVALLNCVMAQQLTEVSIGMCKLSRKATPR